MFPLYALAFYWLIFCGMPTPKAPRDDPFSVHPKIQRRGYA